MKDRQRRKEKKLCGEVYQFVVDQLIGLFEIDFGNYLYFETGLYLHYDRWANGGLDIYIFDPDYCFTNRWDKIDFYVDGVDDILLIEHLHSDDILYFILNYQKEKTKIKKRIQEYIRFKKSKEVK